MARLISVIIIFSMLMASVVPGIFMGCSTAPQQEGELFTNGQIPPIDRMAPENTKLATFALG
jgi:hypothetical protein